MRAKADRIGFQNYHIGQAYRKALEANQTELAKTIYEANPEAKAEMDIQKRCVQDAQKELLHA